MKSSIWLQTAAGNIVKVEEEIARLCPQICHQLQCGVGSTESNPICLPPKVEATALDSIFDYCRFHQTPGRSNKERKLFDNEFLGKDTETLCMLAHAVHCLKLKELQSKICKAIARIIGNSSPEEIQDFINIATERGEEEKLEPQKNPNGDQRIRLSNKLLAKKKKELEEVEDVKKTEAEVEAQKHEDRSIDDLISFINGGDGDSKGVQKSKKKKNNRTKKERQKNAPSVYASSSTVPSSFKNAIENHDKESNACDGASHSFKSTGDLSSTVSDTSKLPETRDGSPTLENEFDDDDFDPAWKEMVDREVEDFARKLNVILEYPRPPIDGNGSMTNEGETSNSKKDKDKWKDV